MNISDAPVYRYKLTLEFFGTGLVGWQKQNVGRSVQGILAEAAKKFCHHDVTFHAAGRTDAGVHALGMICHVDLPQEYPAYKVMDALNYHLKWQPVSVLASTRVSEEFQARFSATKRYYRYHIINRRAPLTFQTDRAWHVKFPLDADLMHEAAQLLVGHHDFTTFRSVECQSQSPVKTLDQLDVWREGENIYIDTSARSFLHHQVRSMVGSLYYVGRGKWTKRQLQQSLEACNRTALAHNAPPDGLYFVSVDYPEDFEIKK
ncbi:tRNA pseudouridine(38-40) synthase TruA [Paremcibacter congregatus]|uniref:tRNA pseudouridine(38-40) synthase TruA n=1 Tax=Paremcibacter congregatus TaxID=2043170 RepID=UPI003A94B995